VFAAPARANPIQVTTLADSTGNPMDCSLREAIDSANADGALGGCTAGGGADVVLLGAGTYVLSKGPAGDDNNASGDLDALAVGGNLSIIGMGASRTTISAQGLGDRVVDVPR
jgi:CSLREA domain-containing protein